MPIEFIAGLPKLTGPLVDKAREIGVPVMISANALSRWRTVRPPKAGSSRSRSGKINAQSFETYKVWEGWNTANLANLNGLAAHLDSAGFVAMSKYNGFQWSVMAYMDLAAAHPWVRFSSMDLCVEKAIAPDTAAVMDRIAGTVNLNNACRREAIDRGINDRFMPVIQGFSHDQYYRCIDMMPWIEDYYYIGVGSMCSRKSTAEILHIVVMLDRYIPQHVRFHLFGLKSDAAEALRGFEHRVASVDSQSYGTEARNEAIDIRRAAGEFDDGRQPDLFADKEARPSTSFSKSDHFVASVMERYVGRQQLRLAKKGFVLQDTLLLPPPQTEAPRCEWERALIKAREFLRDLVADNELDGIRRSFHL